MKKICILLFALASGIATAWAGAQDTLRSFSCDFEDVAQDYEWHMPAAQGIGHQWCIGPAINNGGNYSMYVTADRGQSPSYKNQSALVIAYIDVTLRSSTEKYLLSFDWQAAGFTETEGDGLYVFWIPAVDPDLGDSIDLDSQSNNVIPEDWKPYMLQLNVSRQLDYLRGEPTWQAFLSTNTSQTDNRLTRGGEHYRLVFAWRTGTDGPVNPSACIDNIVIADGRACRAPRKIMADMYGSDSLVVSWKPDTCCQNYEVGCYSYEDSVWITYQTTDSSYTYLNVPEGFCDFYVRTICYDTVTGDDFYSAKRQLSKFIYYPDNHCVDYITMTDENCYISTVKPSYVTGDYKYIHEMVDFGGSSIQSRHTHHYSKTETDPLTRGKLKRVPEGELCSSRLGNWNNGNESERAEFKFHVDAKKNPILVLKYAVVLETPDHDKDKPRTATNLEDPRFKMDILRKGHSISKCTRADFNASWVNDGWTRDTVNVLIPTPSGLTVTQKHVVWKDWTTVGINLAEFDGEDLTIQLTTFDCSMGGHFGYAYFVLGCDDVDLSGETCSGTPVEDFKAPAGFKYRWYKADEGREHVLATTQDFHIDKTDTLPYRVDVIFPEDEDCYFTLAASSQPHEPLPEIGYRYVPRDCQNFIRVTNNARVRHVKIYAGFDKVEHRDTSYTPVDSCHWYTHTLQGVALPAPGDSIDIPLPDEGGVYDLGIISYYNNCENARTYTFTVPAIYRDTVVIDTLLIDDQTITIDGRVIDKPGTYETMEWTYQGCLNPTIYHVAYHENIHVTPFVQPICANDEEWTLSYEYKGMRAGARYSISTADGFFEAVDSARIPTDVDAITVPLIHPIRPGYYSVNLAFHDSLYGTHPSILNWSDTLMLTIRYADTILAQRWDDILAVRNADYNGGYEFIAYQWYKNGEPLLLADTLTRTDTTSVLKFLDEEMDLDAEYQVLLTRAGDSLQVMTCPIRLSEEEASKESKPYLQDSRQPAAAAKRMENGMLIIEREERRYNSTGQRVR